MPRDVHSYFEDMAKACDNIRQLTRALTLEDYLKSNTVRWAVERQFSILGEALCQLQSHSPEIAAKIPEASVTSWSTDTRKCRMRWFGASLNRGFPCSVRPLRGS